MFILEPLCIRECNQTLKHLHGLSWLWLVYWKIRRHSHTSNHRWDIQLMMRKAVKPLVYISYLFAERNLNICRNDWMTLEHYHTWWLSFCKMYISDNTFTMVFLKVDLIKNVLKYLENSSYLFPHVSSVRYLLWDCERATIKLISRAKRDYFSHMIDLILIWIVEHKLSWNCKV